MTYMETEIYLGTVWDHLSEGLRQRIVSAVQKSKSSGKADVLVDTLSTEERDEVDFLCARDDKERGHAFIAMNVGQGDKKRAAIKLTNDMVHYVDSRMLGLQSQPVSKPK